MYNAGTDILEGDPLGNLSITAQVSCIKWSNVYLRGNSLIIY